MNLYWNVRPHLGRVKPPIENANQLGERTGIPLPTCYRCFDPDTPLERIDVRTVRTLTAFFKLRGQWWKLFRVGA